VFGQGENGRFSPLTNGNDFSRVCPQCAAQQELQHADFVPTVNGSAEVVPLHVEAVEPERRAQLIRLLDWCREYPQRDMGKLRRERGELPEERQRLSRSCGPFGWFGRVIHGLSRFVDQPVRVVDQIQWQREKAIGYAGAVMHRVGGIQQGRFVGVEAKGQTRILLGHELPQRA
jgi:hypothetical protein